MQMYHFTLNRYKKTHSSTGSDAVQRSISTVRSFWIDSFENKGREQI